MKATIVSMVESDWDSLLSAVHRSRTNIALVVTGGGTGAVARCFRREGASNNFVDAAIPYSHAALREYLGCDPMGSNASGAVAHQLASKALDRATRFSEHPPVTGEAAGIALVAALPTTPRRRGKDRIHVAIETRKRTVIWSLELEKDSVEREAAETIADEMVFRALAVLVHHDENERFFQQAGLDLDGVCVDT